MSNNQAAQAATQGASIEAERADFEVEAVKRGINIERAKQFPDRYKYEYAAQMWEFWQAARRSPAAAIAADRAQQAGAAAPLTGSIAEALAMRDAEIADLRAQLAATTENLQTAVQQAWKANAELSKLRTMPASAQPADPGLFMDEATRLRRVVNLLGIQHQVPGDDASLRECLFSVLGLIARKLEAGAQPDQLESAAEAALNVSATEAEKETRS